MVKTRLGWGCTASLEPGLSPLKYDTPQCFRKTICYESRTKPMKGLWTIEVQKTHLPDKPGRHFNSFHSNFRIISALVKAEFLEPWFSPPLTHMHKLEFWFRHYLFVLLTVWFLQYICHQRLKLCLESFAKSRDLASYLGKPQLWGSLRRSWMLLPGSFLPFEHFLLKTASTAVFLEPRFPYFFQWVQPWEEMYVNLCNPTWRHFVSEWLCLVQMNWTSCEQLWTTNLTMSQIQPQCFLKRLCDIK